jgi:deazaflavin-dependent oxidoreductase (nitroreductase family)
VSYRQMLGGAPPFAWPFLLLLDPGAFVMERKMLLEIKRRAEQSCGETARRPPLDRTAKKFRKGTLRERRKNSIYERWMNRAWFRLVAAGLVPRQWPGSPILGSTTLEVRGRRSGVMRRVPVTWVQVGDERYLVAMMGEESDWVHNARAKGGHVTFKRGHQREAVLEELPVDERAPIIQAWYKRTGSSTPREYIGLEPDAALVAFDEISPRWPVFRITPRDALP